MATKKEATEVKEPAKGRLMTKIKLFKDSGKYKDDVIVGLNGKFWQIQRGVEVEVPDDVAEIIIQSMKQDDETANLIARETTYAKNADALL